MSTPSQHDINLTSPTLHQSPVFVCDPKHVGLIERVVDSIPVSAILQDCSSTLDPSEHCENLKSQILKHLVSSTSSSPATLSMDSFSRWHDAERFALRFRAQRALRAALNVPDHLFVTALKYLIHINRVACRSGDIPTAPPEIENLLCASLR